MFFYGQQTAGWICGYDLAMREKRAQRDLYLSQLVLSSIHAGSLLLIDVTSGHACSLPVDT